MPDGGRNAKRPDVEALRRAYARHLLDHNGIENNAGLLRAFSVVPRERFLGPPPWRMHSFGQPATEIAAGDLSHVYSDVLFALDEAKGINNGQPSLHAKLIDALAPQPGERIVHVGAGTGYYTAILAELVGPSGHVLAIEADKGLGELARANLADRGNVSVAIGDGADVPMQPADGVYVSFAVAAPVDKWLDGLTPGGRLVFPLGVPGAGRAGVRYSDRGAMLLVTRQQSGFAARFLCPAIFIFATGGASETNPEIIAGLERAFAGGRLGAVRSLIWRAQADPARCWFHSEAWSLSFDDPWPH